MSRFCRDCLAARVAGRDALDEPVCRCVLGCWGPESWRVALVTPSCADFVLAAEQPDDLDFWGLQPGHGLEPEPRRYKGNNRPTGGRGTKGDSR